MRFRILGPLEIRGSGGEQIRVGAPKQRVLLAVLLLNANQPVSPGRLEAALWPGLPPDSVNAILRTYVSGLRGALHLSERERLPRLTKEPAGYQLALLPDDLDLAMFDDLSARGRQALRLGDPARAARLLSDALALWRGEPAEEVALDVDGSATLADLAERRLFAEEAWADARLALGGGADLIGRLRALVTDQPLRERARGHLMLALYRSGRKAEALEEFRALRRRMADELGIEPSTPVQELHRQILADDPALAPASALPPTAPRQLPRDIGDFTGRDVQLREMKALLAQADLGSPVITVIMGTPGAGKTALAVHFAHQVADRFPDGQLYADLHGHAEGAPVSPAEVLRRFLHALGPKEVPGDPDEAAALYRSLLAGKRTLILLDNATTASQVRPLLPGSADCLVLVTSRSRLPGLLARDSAAPVTVGPLAESEGVILLRRILGDSRVDAEPDAAAALVARCASLPLALRVAAERAAYRPRLSLAGLATELADEQHRLDKLTSGEDVYATVRSAFSWSYRNLAPDAGRMFRLLGLHPGPDIGVPAAAAVCATSPAQAQRLLEVLAAEHLVDEVAAGRYRLHDLLRVYAAERAAADESPTDRVAAIWRVITWYLHTAGKE
jgi:DNA-binding SARP family transcriptional activator